MRVLGGGGGRRAAPQEGACGQGPWRGKGQGAEVRREAEEGEL